MRSGGARKTVRHQSRANQMMPDEIFAESGRKKGLSREDKYLYVYAYLQIERIPLMKKVRMAALVLALCLSLFGGCQAQEAQQSFRILTTFYPMYVFTLNIADGIEGVTVENMADQSVGCLHDYQLQTRDMVALEKADALVINGGGMEQFMDKVISLRGDLPVITASEGIEMLPASGHDHEHEDGECGELNAHVWLDPQLAILQVENIAAGLAQADPAHAQAYLDNAAAYTARIAQLDEEMSAMLAPVAGEQIITFHEAFPYFAQAFDIEIAGVIEHEAGEDPGTREIAQTCDLVNELGIRALFVEPQYPQKAAETIARETGAGLYTLDPVVSGDASKESYETIMRENARVLLEALSK